MYTIYTIVIQYIEYIEYIQYILTTLIYCKCLPTSCKGFRMSVFVRFLLAESQPALRAFLLHGLMYFIPVTCSSFASPLPDFNVDGLLALSGIVLGGTPKKRKQKTI